MTKPSYGLVVLFAGWGAAAEAAPPPAGYVTADEAMRHYHETFGVAADRGCPAAEAGSDEAIVVCANTKRPYRLPLPIEREPGEITRHANDPGSSNALPPDACTRACLQPITINLIDAARAAPKIIRHILGHDD